MHIQGLTLADESTTVGGEVEDFLLTDLPDGFIDRLDVVRDTGDALDRTIVSNDNVLHLVTPETAFNEVLKQPGTDDLEFSGQDTTSVDVTV